MKSQFDSGMHGAHAGHERLVHHHAVHHHAGHAHAARDHAADELAADELSAEELAAHEHHGVLAGSLSRDFADSTILSDHIHEMGQLKFALTGVMIVASSDGHWVVPPTRALWLAPNVRHRVRMLGKVQLRSVFVNPLSPHGLPEKSCLLPASPLFREVIAEVATSSLHRRASKRTRLLMELLLEEVHGQSNTPIRLPAPRDHRLAAICTHIQEHLEDMKSLQEWAKELGYDERTLHRLFIQELGLSFLQWRQQAKLLAALEWLAEGRPILSIALDLGYQTQSAFTSMFRRNLGMSPSEFKKNLPTS